MRIGQAIDEIMINEEKEFEGSVDGFSYRISCINGEIETMVINESIGEGVKKIILGLPYTRVLKNVDWRLMQKPVAFMEAFEHFRKGGKIEVICEGMNDKIFEGGSEIHFLFHEEYIENGKWYIKEGN